MAITKRQFVNYAILPGFRPRLQNLFSSGFQYIPFFMAMVYQAVRLLPATHPYTNPANIGQFGIRHVVAEAANNLRLDRKNIDQIILFFTLLIGLALVFIQILLVCFSLFFSQAMAMPTSFAGFFITPAATEANDLAYIMLDLVFGIPDIFNSCVSQQIDCLLDIDAIDTSGASPGTDSLVDPWITGGFNYPFPIHEGLHQMFQLYSTGLLVVATMITLYFIVTILAETAQTGTAFGKRFNKVWAPLRLVMAFGLLIPVGYGLNSAQYIVLYAAKFGSGFATNGWVLFNDTLLAASLSGVNNMLVNEDADSADLVSLPNVPEVGGLLQFMYVARTCAELYKLKYDADIKVYLVKDPSAATPAIEVIHGGGNTFPYSGAPSLINFINGAKNAVIRFGIQDQEQYPFYKGFVAPLCGEITIPLSDPRDPTHPDAWGKPERGAEIMQRYYLFVIQELWYNVYRGCNPPVGWPVTCAPIIAGWTENFPQNTARLNTQWDPDPNLVPPPPEYRSDLQTFYKNDLVYAMTDPSSGGLEIADPGIGTIGALPEQVASGTWAMDEILKEKGWAAAGIWYNKVAQLNGAVSSAVLNIPVASRYPEIMELVLMKKKQQDQFVPVNERYKPQLAGGRDVFGSKPADQQMATAMWVAFDYWQSGGHTTTSHTAVSGNAFIDAINAIFGTEGLYSMRRNPDIHPLAQLVGVGRSLVESSTRNIGYAVFGGVSGAAMSFIDEFAGNMMSTAASFLVTVAMIGLTAGFVLYYVVPFLPFIYFFFAVGGWIKGIFEAMVGAPLWALAHIRIDGNGLPGQAAVNGYFLVFEIFLRPILIIFGLLASISIYSALVATLNQTWDLVRTNLAGFDVRAEVEGVGTPELEFMRGPIDEFFFTVIYTIIVYMMGMSSFKLIDLIPNNILRWMGQSVATFNDQREDPAQGLVGTATVGAQQTLSSLGGGLQGIANLGKG